MSYDWIWFQIGLTAITFFLLGTETISAVIPNELVKLRRYLKLWLFVKIILGIIYFNSFFVERSLNETKIVEYGDSFTHHNVATSYFEYWLDGELFINPIEVTYQVEQWGYNYFVGVLYFITGPIPEVAIIVNSFLALILCLLGYKLFIIASSSPKQASYGTVFFSLSPILWSLSSLIYKDMLLFVIILICIIQIYKLMHKVEIDSFLLLIFLLPILLVMRYSYLFVVLSFMVLGNIYLGYKLFKKTFNYHSISNSFTNIN